MQETWVQSLGQKDALEKGMATHSRILAWEIPWTEEPGGLQSMGSQRIRHDWATHTFLHTMYTILYTLHTVLVKVTQSCPTLCSHVDCSPPRSSVHGILQARILEWLPFPSTGDLPNPGTEPDSLLSEPPGKPSNQRSNMVSLSRCSKAETLLCQQRFV